MEKVKFCFSSKEIELKVKAEKLSNHQMRMVVTSIGDQEYKKSNGCWPAEEQSATAWGLAALIRAAGYVHKEEEVASMAKNLQQMLQEKWEEQLSRG